MSSPNRRWEAILDYPSRESATDLVIALVERSSSVVTPDQWPENESIYLQDDDATRFSEFRDAIDGAISAAEPADWLLRELNDFGRSDRLKGRTHESHVTGDLAPVSCANSFPDAKGAGFKPAPFACSGNPAKPITHRRSDS